MTKAELLASADSAELTEWQAYLAALAEEEQAREHGKDGHRIQWNDDLAEARMARIEQGAVIRPRRCANTVTRGLTGKKVRLMNDPATKRCCTCKQSKPLTEFGRCRSRDDGLNPRCKLCAQAASANWHATHREQRAEEGRRWRQATGYGRRYYETNKTEILEKQAAYYQENRETIREREKRKYQDDPGYFLQRSRQWVADNPGKVSDYQRQYHRDNRDSRLANMRLYNAHAAALVFNHYGYVCACCGTEKKLTTDHVNGDGAQHRLELFGDARKGGSRFCHWLVDNGFPDDPPIQILCQPCNSSKRKGAHCRLKHRVGMPLWRPFP